ncbi:hypothetical protein BESB_039440 [Besnoitia besnoiti]|uniref:tRNA/rRNA methyltransferase SpoU type domain-containing protein n=1 Tax=Besnoitia besnoiti TaxID=94643 RepID=A0A2A9MMW2_BESBE|nr:hypothetical protein BESB_039440 [Besnoitia besnoiti]PFH37486.1 hypothetical protein BESB_039440 [Besnoitia besnoiti]
MPPTPGILMPPTPGTLMPPTPGTLMPPTPGTLMPPTPGTLMPPTPGTLMPPTPGTLSPHPQPPPALFKMFPLPSPPPSSSSASNSPPVAAGSPFSPVLVSLVRFCCDLSRLPVTPSAAHPLLSSFVAQLLTSPSSPPCAPDSRSDAVSAQGAHSREALLREISSLLLPNALFQWRLAKLQESGASARPVPFSASFLSAASQNSCLSSPSAPGYSRAQDAHRNCGASDAERAAEREDALPHAAHGATAFFGSSASSLADSPLSLPVVRLLLEAFLLLLHACSNEQRQALIFPPSAAASSARAPRALQGVLRPFRLLLLLASSSVSASSKREGKGEKKARRRERESAKHNKDAASANDAEASAAPKGRLNKKRGKEANPQLALSWVLQGPPQDKATLARLASRVLFEASAPQPPASSAACEPCRRLRGRGDSETGGGRERLSAGEQDAAEADFGLLFTPCACALSAGSEWVMSELLCTRERILDAEEFQHGDLGLTRAEEAARGGADADKAGRQAPGDEVDTRAEDAHGIRFDEALTCEGTCAMLEMWLALLNERKEHLEIRRLSRRLLPLLHELVTSPVFRSQRKCMFTRVLPRVLRHGLNPRQAAVFMLSLVSTLLDGRTSFCLSTAERGLLSSLAPEDGAAQEQAADAQCALAHPTLVFPPSSCFVAASAPSLNSQTTAVSAPGSVLFSRTVSARPNGTGHRAPEPTVGSAKCLEAPRSKLEQLADREDAFDLALRFPDIFFCAAFSLKRFGDDMLCVAQRGVGARDPCLDSADARWTWLFAGLVDSAPLSRKRARALLEHVQAAVQQPLLHTLRERQKAAQRGQRAKARESGPAGLSSCDASGAGADGEEARLSMFEQELKSCGVSAEEQEVGWQAFLQLLEALEDFSQHLIKQQWKHMRRLCALAAKVSLSRLLARSAPPREAKKAAGIGHKASAFVALSCVSFAPSGAAGPVLTDAREMEADAEGAPRPAGGEAPPAVSPLILQPLWVETVLKRILSHDNALLTRSLLLVFLSSCIEDLHLYPLLWEFLRPSPKASAAGKPSATGEVGCTGGASEEAENAERRNDAAGRDFGSGTVSSSSVWTSATNLAARAAAAAEGGGGKAVSSIQGTDADGERPPELLCIGWDFFLHALLPNLAASNLYSRSSDSHIVEKVVKKFIQSRLVAEFLIHAWRLRAAGRHAGDAVNGEARSQRLSAPHGRDSNSSACAQCSAWGAEPHAEGCLCLESPFSLSGDAMTFLRGLAPCAYHEAAEKSVGGFVVAMSACNMTYTPFRIWLQALNGLPTWGSPSAPLLRSSSASSGGGRAASAATPRALCRLGRGFSRAQAPAFVALLRLLFEHIPAVIRSSLFSRLLQFLSLHAQRSALSPLDLALLFADAGDALTAPCPATAAAAPPRTTNAETPGTIRSPTPTSEGQRLLLTFFPDAAAFRASVLALFAALLRDAPAPERGDGETDAALEACESSGSETSCVADFPRDILCEKVAVGCLRMCGLAKGLSGGYDVQHEIAVLLFSSPALLRVYSRPALPSLAVRSKLAALSAFLRSEYIYRASASLPSPSSSPGASLETASAAAPFASELPLVAGEVVSYIVCHLTALMQADASAEAESDGSASAFSTNALCLNLPVYVSAVASLSLLASAGLQLRCIDTVTSRCEDIIQALGVDAASQKSPRDLILVSAALCLLAASVSHLLPPTADTLAPATPCGTDAAAAADADMEDRMKKASLRLFLVFLAKVNRPLATQHRHAALASLLETGEGDRKGSGSLLTTLSSSPSRMPVSSLPLSPADPRSASCSSSSLFAFAEVGDFSSWPGVISSFHRARATLLDTLSSATLRASRAVSSDAAAPLACSSLVGCFLQHEMMAQRAPAAAEHFQASDAAPSSSPPSASPSGSASLSLLSLPLPPSSLPREEILVVCPAAELELLSERLLSALALHIQRASDQDSEFARLAASRVRSPSASVLSLPRVVALGLLSEIEGCPPAALASLFRAIRRFALPLLLLPHHGPLGAEGTSPGALAALQALLVEFTTQTERIISDRTETALPLSAVREACLAVLSPLMLATESRCLRREERSRRNDHGGSDPQDDDAEAQSGPHDQKGAFVLNFAKALLGLGKNTLAVSRAAVVPLLSSLAVLGVHGATAGLESGEGDAGRRRISASSPPASSPPASPAASSGPRFFQLSDAYIRLLAEVLLHREFILLDGASATTVDPFGASAPWLAQDDQEEASLWRTPSSPLSVLTCSDPAAFFVASSPLCRAADQRASSCKPLFLPARLATLRQTPAFVRLLALSFFHLLGRASCTPATEKAGEMASSSEPQEGPEASLVVSLAASLSFKAFARDLLFRVSSRLLDIVTRAPSHSGGSREAAEDGDDGGAVGRDGEERKLGRNPGNYLPMPNSCHHRILLRGWQALASFAPFFRCAPAPVLDTLHTQIWKAVTMPQLADVRHYIDIMAVQVLLMFPTQSCTPLAAILLNFDSPTQTLIGALTIAGFFLLHEADAERVGGESKSLATMPNGDREHVKHTLFAAVAPYLTSNAAYPRGVAQYVVYEYLNKSRKDHQTPLAMGASEEQRNLRDQVGAAAAPTESSPFDKTSGGSLGAAVLHGLYRQLEESKECRKMRAKCSEVFPLWQPHVLGSLDSLLTVGPEGTSDVLYDAANKATASALAGIAVPPPPSSSSALGSAALGEGDGALGVEAVARTVLADFDLRPSWALAVALKDAIKEEMGVAWHGKGQEGEETMDNVVASLAARATSPGDKGEGEAKGAAPPTSAPNELDRNTSKEANAARDERDADGEKRAAGEKQDLVCQRKFVPQQNQRSKEDETARADLVSPWLYVGGEGEALERELRQRGELVVVASLVNKVPNLAGLARTCEVFDAKKLIIHNLDILNDPQFNTIGVSAHRWLPIEQVSADEVATYLMELKAQGYTVVGVEQTGSSEMLEAFTFDRKTALVLGAEKEGLPAALLVLMDACIEIPQLGLIRSLNVHVTGAMVIWEYTKQHALA